MSEFFKQVIAQIVAIWERLSLQQKLITVSLVAFTILGLAGLMLFAQKNVSSANGYKVLYSDLTLDEAAAITKKLQESKKEYKLENEGRTILIKEKNLYETRMDLARDGLPKSHGIGYEIFDKTNLGMTDFVQKINARRALEGELQRTIEGLAEVKAVRVHISVPEPTIFLDQKEEAKASVVVQTVPGATLSKEQIRGITYVVSSSVEGLKPEQISVVDYEGRLLTSPYADDGTAMTSSRNYELQQQVEKYLENKANQILAGVVGAGRATVKIAAELDFDKVEKNIETYDPESRVVRSEEHSDDNTKNAPTGDRTSEKSLTNYEINKTVESLVAGVGTVKRLTVSVAIDGKYETGKDGKETYVARSAEFLASIEDMVKNAVGYSIARGDLISVANVQFDGSHIQSERESIANQEKWELYFRIAKYALAALLIILIIFFLRYIAKTLAEAMNPPVPQITPLGLPEALPQELPEEVRRTSEILDKVEMLTREEPVNIASIVRQWLNEPMPASHKKNK